VRGPIKHETAQLELDGLKVEQMFKPDDTTAVKTVKISAPFPLKAYQRLIIVNGVAVNVAASAGRQQGDYLYSALITLLHEDAAVYTSAPCWASVEVE
jgi:hypothetical protein